MIYLRRSDSPGYVGRGYKTLASGRVLKTSFLNYIGNLNNRNIAYRVGGFARPPEEIPGSATSIPTGVPPTGTFDDRAHPKNLHLESFFVRVGEIKLK